MDRLEIAIAAAVAGGEAIMAMYEGSYAVEQKANNTPLTEADIASNAIINRYLEPTKIPIISEENKQVDYEHRKDWDICWIVDPLDGTKEFIKRNGEFTVNIALCSKGRPILGVIYVPVTKEIYYADAIKKEAFKTTSTQPLSAVEFRHDKDRIAPPRFDPNHIRVIGSRSHMNENTMRFIEELKVKYDTVEIVSKGSSLKFCLVAEGSADVYPRFTPTMEWDTAAGQAICNAVGIDIVDLDTGAPLSYNRENMTNPNFLVNTSQLK